MFPSADSRTHASPWEEASCNQVVLSVNKALSTCYTDGVTSATRAYVSRMSEKVSCVVPRAMGQNCECLLMNIDLLLIRVPRSSEEHKALLSIQIAVLRSTLYEGLVMPPHTHSMS
ncbi:hypothetical protein AMECASPLE_026591 [Ameca splendens]|uniref:Uncharacterized protein n=1 Tax=Ameca splendens TaxID=208324 RepID=A0ABV0ZET1_9TELE